MNNELVAVCFLWEDEASPLEIFHLDCVQIEASQSTIEVVTSAVLTMNLAKILIRQDTHGGLFHRTIGILRNAWRAVKELFRRTKVHSRAAVGLLAV